MRGESTSISASIIEKENYILANQVQNLSTFGHAKLCKNTFVTITV